MLLRIALALGIGYFLVKYSAIFLIRERIERPERLNLILTTITLFSVFVIYYSVIYSFTGKFHLASSLVSLIVFTSLVIILEPEAPLRLWPTAYLLTLLTLPFLLKFVIVREPFAFRFVQVGLREEGFKFINIFILFLLGKIGNRKDSIVAGASVGAIFGSLENYLYGTKFGFSTFALRNLLPIHLSLSALMALFFHQTLRGRLRFLWFLATVVIPPFLHWAYDFSLQTTRAIIPYFLLNLLLYSLVYLIARDGK